MKVQQSILFGRQKKKLHKNQITYLDQAIKNILENQKIGERKKGDLSTIRVYKFKISVHEYLLAYTIANENIILLAVGSHENFYRDLKRSMLKKISDV